MPPPHTTDTVLLEVANRLDCVVLRGSNLDGLERFAKMVHDAGPHAGGRFVSVRTDLMPNTLLELELFGWGKGAFPSPPGCYRRGRLELANRGTLFMSEITALSPKTQQELLRVLNRREVRPITYEEITTPVEPRLIAGTREDLAAAVRAGRFRHDLYERLAATVITVPPPTLQS